MHKCCSIFIRKKCFHFHGRYFCVRYNQVSSNEIICDESILTYWKIMLGADSITKVFKIIFNEDGIFGFPLKLIMSINISSCNFFFVEKKFNILKNWILHEFRSRSKPTLKFAVLCVAQITPVKMSYKIRVVLRALRRNWNESTSDEQQPRHVSFFKHYLVKCSSWISS